MHEESLERLIQLARETNRQIEYTTERVVVRASPRLDGEDKEGNPYETVSVSRPITLTGASKTHLTEEPQQATGEDTSPQPGRSESDAS